MGGEAQVMAGPWEVGTGRCSRWGSRMMRTSGGQLEKGRSGELRETDTY